MFRLLRMLREARFYAKLALGLRRLSQTPPHVVFEASIQDQLEHREERWLALVREVIYGQDSHPYRRMMAEARCEWDDLASLVRSSGLTRALEALRESGVYLSHDEFKGRTTIVRGGREIEATSDSFNNPTADGLLGTISSGSRSGGTFTFESIEYRLYRENYYRLVWKEFGLSDYEVLALEAILPSQNGIASCLKTSRIGSRLEKWYSVGGALRDSWHYRAATAGFVALGNLLGAKGRYPDYLPDDDFLPVADWLAGRRAAGASCVVETNVSSAVRVSAAACDSGLDISSTLFLVGGETLSSPKRLAIERSGAAPYPNYWLTETGPVGYACLSMTTGSSVHLFEDSLEAIQYRRRLPGSSEEVNSLLLTTLHPSAPRVLINVETDDAGVIEQARCECCFSRLGLRRVIRDVASYGKLTGMGVTLSTWDLVNLLEVRLPARFGGGPGDYQLAETEGRNGSSRVCLRFSPRLETVAPQEIRQGFLTELKRCHGGSTAIRAWSHAGVFTVEQSAPITGATGKVLPVCLLRD